MKLKSHSSTKKRVKISGRGKLLMRKSSKQHLLINKSKRQKALYNVGKPVNPADQRKLRHLLPFASKS